MALIVWTVYKQERLIKTYMARVHTSDNSKNLAMCRSRHQFTRTIMVQALSYMVVYLFFALDVFYIAFNDLSSPESKSGEQEDLLPLWGRYYYLTAKPMQGFVYFLVFVGHKVYGIRQVSSNLTISKAVLRVLMVREEPNFYISQISLVNGDLNNENEDEMYFVGDDEDDYEEEDISRMYPFPGQNVDEDDYEEEERQNVDEQDDATSNIISFERGSVSGGERSSFGPASWFSMSTGTSEAISVPRNRRKPGHNVDEDDAISGISGKMDRQNDDDMEEIKISAKSVDSFADDSAGGAAYDSRGELSSIGPASWFSRSTRRSEASSVKDNSKE